ncbi:MAG: hypothetical protein ACXAD7_10545 [Candidatus Kariarchaeaceae archaeon]
MKFYRVFILIYLGFILFFGYSVPVSAREPVGGIERDYYFRIELSQWSIKVYDMNQIEDLMLQGMAKEKAMKQSLYKDKIGTLVKGSHVFFEIYSLDVQHGFSAKELDIKVVVTKPTDEYNKPTLVDFGVPDDDVSISSSCHVYCGIGHSDMKLKIIIGEGDPEIGKIIFALSIGLNLILFILALRSLFKPRPFKVYIIPVDIVHSNNTDRKNFGVKIYDVSHLSEKQIIGLRWKNQHIDEIADLIDCYSGFSRENVMDLANVECGNQNWKIVK